MVGVLANQAPNYFVSGKAPHRIGNGHLNIVPYQTFPTRDGHVMIAVGSDSQFTKLCTILGRADIATDASYATNALRVQNRAVLIPALRQELLSWGRDELLPRLADSGVPAGPINTIADVFADSQVRARGMRVDFNRPEVAGGVLSGLRTPITFSSSRLCLDKPAPHFGEHTSAIARELGIDI